VKKFTLRQFIAKARAVHGKRYGYSKVKYQGSAKRVTIICKVHGKFRQKPADHIQGSGCKHCRGSR
jgi:hypothetical protein